MITINVWKIRTKQYLTLNELAKISTVSRAEINNIENKLKSPTLSTLELTAKALDCKIKDLFDED